MEGELKSTHDDLDKAKSENRDLKEYIKQADECIEI